MFDVLGVCGPVLATENGSICLGCGVFSDDVPCITYDRVPIVLQQSDWYGRSLYDLIHPDDIEKLREQLSANEAQPPGRILDLKSMRACT